MKLSDLPHDIKLKIIEYLIPSWTIPRELKGEIVEYPLMKSFRDLIGLTGSRNASFGVLYNIITEKFKPYVYFLHKNYEVKCLRFWKSITDEQRDRLRLLYLNDIFRSIESIFMEDLCKFHVEYRDLDSD